MNKYTKLSDFEINKKVAISIGFSCYYGDGSYTNGGGLRAAIVRGKNHNGNFMLGGFDPCNNPSDAMPIIIENKICTAFDVFAEEHDGGNWVASPAYGFASERTRSNNFYRAAMEVFLLMKDAENE